jgi:hypothetical protein
MDRRTIALKSLLSHSEAKLVANANYEDNFTLWAAPIVWDAIIGTFQNLTKDDAECDEYNKLCEEATVVEVDRRYYGGSLQSTREYRDVRATKSPLVRSICKEAYEELQAT